MTLAASASSVTRKHYRSHAIGRRFREIPRQIGSWLSPCHVATTSAHGRCVGTADVGKTLCQAAQGLKVTRG